MIGPARVAAIVKDRTERGRFAAGTTSGGSRASGRRRSTRSGTWWRRGVSAVQPRPVSPPTCRSSARPPRSLAPLPPPSLPAAAAVDVSANAPSTVKPSALSTARRSATVPLRLNGGPLAVAVLEDLEEIAALLVGGRREAPVVEDEDARIGRSGRTADVTRDRALDTSSDRPYDTIGGIVAFEGRQLAVPALDVTRLWNRSRGAQRRLTGR